MVGDCDVWPTSAIFLPGSKIQSAQLQDIFSLFLGTHRNLTTQSSQQSLVSYFSPKYDVVKMASKLSAAICQGQWDLCITMAKNEPRSAAIFAIKPGSLAQGTHMFRGDMQGLPLHEAVTVGAPFNVIDAIARAYPEALSKRDIVMKRLPIHLACNREQGVDAKIVSLLGKYYLKSLAEADKLGRVPLHYALQNKASDLIIKNMIQLSPNVAKAQDKKCVVPLHVACLAGASTDVIDMLLKLNPNAAVMTNSTGRDALAYCNECNAPNKFVVTDMLSKYKIQAEGQFRLAKQPSSRRLFV